MNKKISVIMPFVNEWPQIAFTIRAVREELEGFCDYEIIAIDNYCKEVEEQGQVPDRAHDGYVLNKKRIPMYGETIHPEAQYSQGHIKAQAYQHDWLKYYSYDSKLSHWNAKNYGVSKSTGEILLFLDAHVMPSYHSLVYAACYYNAMMGHKEFQNDTLHLPLSYHILENKRLAYKLVYQPRLGNVHYSFTSFLEKDGEEPGISECLGPDNLKEYITELPCMSTCGMFMSRKLYDKLGGWPEVMGIYGGGENFINFSLAIIGGRKFISNYGTLHHHGDRRNYHYNWADYHTNRMAATHCFGGMEWVNKYRTALGNPGNKGVNMMLERAVMGTHDHRRNLKENQVLGIEEWASKWGEKNG